MTNRREIGVVVAYPLSGGSYSIHPNEYTKLRDAWMSGCAFVEVKDLHGGALTLKLKEIEAVGWATPDSTRSQLEEDAAHRQEDAISGSD